MNKKVNLIVAPLFLALAACSTDDGDGSDKSIFVMSVLGNTVDLASTIWQGQCRFDNDSNLDLMEQLTFGSGTVKYEQLYYTAAGASSTPDCSGTPSSSKYFEADITVAADTSAITGWVDGQRNTVNPPGSLANNTNPLSNTAPFTDMTYTFTEINGFTGGPSVGQSAHFFYIIDNTSGAAKALYRGEYTDETALTGARALIHDSFSGNF